MDAIESNSLNADNFCFKWSNYQSHVVGVLVQLLEAQSMVDVTLCASSGEKLFAHKIVLCAASSYFEEIFSSLDDYHPVVILSEVESRVLRSILEFVYHGELNVHASQLTEVLQVAAALQIRGLTEVSDQLPLLVSSDTEVLPPIHLGESERQEVPVLEEVVSNEVDMASYHCDADTEPTTLGDVEYENPSTLQRLQLKQSGELQGDEPVDGTNSELQTGENCSNESESWTADSHLVINAQEQKKKKRRERKEYSEEQLAAALRDLKSGQLLRETAHAHNIPRSTLYVRAKAKGIPITVTRQEHSGENVNAAVQAVNKGASLQQASEMYQIPKTVLWRRVKAAGAGSSRVSARSYGPLHWQAAVQALQEGQNLSRVSARYQIPKTTLFREKSRLIEAGKLPWSSLKKQESQSHSMKHSRLKEAVAACKDGKMSQAVASITYQVPKTTIWRKLHKGTQQGSESDSGEVRSIEVTESGAEDTAGVVSGSLQDQTHFTFIEIVGEDFSTSSLMI
ncbi:hypothetical protein ONE63_009846 [Megalurothrips usitatus]|uniref:BTB domain-containing protein n=1 Tax=Megalurothrips usitatus TaxID=439358 RepID=A0AAV7XFZ0_9NEOP|nr:hypothetical protein ONE63_009846 [Megalurothrips usitatus]